MFISVRNSATSFLFLATHFKMHPQVSMVSRLKHEHVVELLGYCVDGNLRVLAYEFATMGSLHDMLHGMVFAYLCFCFLYSYLELLIELWCYFKL